MTQITVGEIVKFAVALAGFIGAVIYIRTWLANNITELVKEANKEDLQEIKTKIDNIESNQKAIEMDNLKDYLVDCINDLDRGELLVPDRLRRFYERYEQYLKLGGNTYIEAGFKRHEKAGHLSYSGKAVRE